MSSKVTTPQDESSSSPKLQQQSTLTSSSIKPSQSLTEQSLSRLSPKNATSNNNVVVATATDTENHDAASANASPVSTSGHLSTASNASEINPYVAAGVTDPMTLPVDARTKVLILMFILKLITSYDAGAFSIAIGASKGISTELDLDSAQEGFLGSCVYLGNTVGCAVCALLFAKYDAKYLLSLSMMFHAIFTVAFALTSSYALAVLARIGIGFTLSFVVVYSVVWPDVFSPKANATLWLAVINIGVPVGTLAGFLTGGFIINSAVYSWRWIFFVKSIIMVPIVVFMSHIDSKLVDDPLSGTSKGRVTTNNLDTWNSFLSNKLMILNVAGLSVLYFVVTGMQVFFTQYLRSPPFNATIDDIMISFGLTAVSAPIFGVAVGGYVMDKYGNYREHPDRAADLGDCWRLCRNLWRLHSHGEQPHNSFLVSLGPSLLRRRCSSLRNGPHRRRGTPYSEERSE
jgi:MFS family permease